MRISVKHNERVVNLKEAVQIKHAPFYTAIEVLAI